MSAIQIDTDLMVLSSVNTLQIYDTYTRELLGDNVGS